MAGFTRVNVPDLSGRCVIVTGANAGIGWEVALALAGNGARVLMGCRDEVKAEEAMARITAQVPGADLAHLPIDLADLSSVNAAARIASGEPRIDALINNAGVMSKTFARTTQGFELHFGVNYLGVFALTALLLPKLAETPGARIVNTCSLSYRFGLIDWDEINTAKNFGQLRRYAASKLAVMSFTVELDRRLQATGSPVTAYACHPGFAATDILGSTSQMAQILRPISGKFINSAAMAAWPTLQAATDPAATPGGYYGPCQWGGIRGPSGRVGIVEHAMDPALAQRIWDESVRMTGVNPGLPASGGSPV